MADKPLTLGQAIDQIVTALEALDPKTRQTAVDAACSHLGLQTVKDTPSAPSPSPPSTLTQPLHASPPPHSHTTATRVDIRTLKQEKNPGSVKQMACLVAYYLQELAPEGEKKETVSTADLEKYFKQAGFKLPKALDQVLRDAKSSGYFESAGRGEYKLNAVGYNLVVHGLPKSKGE